MGLTLMAGCANELETGYNPRRLNASSDVRRSYYAAPFAAESTPSGGDKAEGEGIHRPGEY
jgi:hypothetical protein